MTVKARRGRERARDQLISSAGLDWSSHNGEKHGSVSSLTRCTRERHHDAGSQIGFLTFLNFCCDCMLIIFADLLCWFCLVFIIIIGFSSAFYVMNQVMDLENNITVPDFAKTLYGSIEMMMGLTNLEVPTATSCPMIYVVYSVFMLLVYLLLLNMLIAMMENTYWRVAQEREELWKIQVAATILLLESHLPRFLTVRTGIPGSCLGLDDKKWYLGVEEILDDYMPERNKLPEGLCTKSTLCWNKIRRNISLIISMNDNTEITVL